MVDITVGISVNEIGKYADDTIRRVKSETNRDNQKNVNQTRSENEVRNMRECMFRLKFPM